jgi:hypothetical protein
MLFSILQNCFFGPFFTAEYGIKANVQRCFMRVTWEGLYERIAEKIPPSVERDLLLDYLRYKTVGYNQSRELQRAFSIPLEPNNTVT